MGIGVALPAAMGSYGAAANAVGYLLEAAHEAAATGVDGVWFSQRYDIDAIGVATLAGREIPEIEVGTSIVPMYPRHPLTLAQQAQTAQAASGGRFTLGIGLSSPAVERTFGVPFDRPVRHLRDYLRVLRSVFETGTVYLHGPTLTADLSKAPFSANVAGAQPPPPILVAAMGTQSLRATGELADGTLPNLAGPKALAEHIVPTVTEAARAAGRPAPRVVAAVTAVVTADVAAVREIAERQMGFYATIESYRRVLAYEGTEQPADLALIGDEDEVAAGIERYLDAGATDVLITQAGMHSDEELRRTWRLAGELARAARH
jgi:F420-dependent oxidoreductase-like protein